MRGWSLGLLEEGQVAAVPVQQWWGRGLDWCVRVWVCVWVCVCSLGSFMLKAKKYIAAKLTWPSCNRLEWK